MNELHRFGKWQHLYGHIEVYRHNDKALLQWALLRIQPGVLVGFNPKAMLYDGRLPGPPSAR
jgi:hypothetical protein